MPTPARANYTFRGWFTGLNRDEPVTDSTPVTADHTLYAYWEGNAVTVTFDPNGGTVSGGGGNPTTTCRYGQPYVFPEGELTPPTGKKWLYPRSR